MLVAVAIIGSSFLAAGCSSGRPESSKAFCRDAVHALTTGEGVRAQPNGADRQSRESPDAGPDASTHTYEHLRTIGPKSLRADLTTIIDSRRHPGTAGTPDQNKKVDAAWHDYLTYLTDHCQLGATTTQPR